MSAEAETVLAEGRAYSKRIAVRMADTVAQRDDFETAAFLAYLQGFKAGMAHAVAAAKECGVITGGQK